LCIGILSGCSAKLPIIRDTVPEPRPEVEIISKHTAVIRTAECDISIIPLTEKEWFSFQEKDSYRLKAFGEPVPPPPCELFFIIVANTGENPLTGLTAFRSAGNTSEPSLATEDINKKMSSFRLSAEVYDRIFAVRRLLSFEYELEKIPLDEDTILYPFPCILPLDRICFIAAFPPVPKDIRTYTVSISYSLKAAKKNVDFRFTRIEHREEE
jgi:hypothetical protein